ncbi:MAG: hypothetical protein K2H85_10330, partial [Allobaculum sp.]|nr:hypothetical protein [Allobaculum sp.]
MAQHVAGKPIEVNVKNSTVSGSAALAIADPQGKQAAKTDTDSDGYDDNIKINVTDKSTLSGSKYDVLYAEETIQFKLDDVTVDEKKIAKVEPKEELNTDSDEYVALVPAQSDSETKPPYVAENITTPVYSSPSGGGNKKPSKPKPEEPAEEPMTPVDTPTTMYRLYNRLTGEHLYTIDKNERDNLLTSDTWKDEGEGWIAPSVSDYPVYRLLNPNNGDHHYTTDKNEFDTLPSYGWVAEGVAFFSADKETPVNVLLHRLSNPNATG